MSATPNDQTRTHSLVVIQPSPRWRAIDLRELWRFRDLFVALGVRDLKLRYRQTALGAVWVVLQPLLAAGIFSFVFGQVADLPSGGVPYFVFAYAGLLGWNIFSDTVTRASASLVSHQAMVSKIFFPRLLLPASTVIAKAIDSGVSAVVMVILLVANDMPLRWQLLALPLCLLLTFMLSLGLGLIAAAYSVTYRDVAYVVPVTIQMLLYASPVAYSLAAVPQDARSYYALNPLVGLIEAYRWSIIGSDLRPAYVAWSAVAGALLLVGGAFVFRGLERRFADVI